MAAEDQCLELSVAQRSLLIAEGWTIVGGPWATEAECIANCGGESGAWYCLETPDTAEPGTGTSTGPEDTEIYIYVDGNFKYVAANRIADFSNNGSRTPEWRSLSATGWNRVDFDWGYTVPNYITFTGYTGTIPSTAVITGIEVTAQVYSEGFGSRLFKDYEFKFINGNPYFEQSSDLSKVNTYPNNGLRSSAEVRAYGSSNTLSGLPRLTPTLINAEGGFGIRWKPVWTNPTPSYSAGSGLFAAIKIDNVRIYYDGTPGPSGGAGISGLRACWALDESAGSDRRDSFGGFALREEGGTVARGVGHIGNCVQFNGSNSLEISTVDFETSGPFGFAAWVYASTSSLSTKCIAGKWASTDGSTKEWNLQLVATTISFNMFSGGASSSEFVIGQWNLVLAWFDGTFAYVRVNDGSISVSAAAVGTVSSGPFILGRDLRWGERFDGRIDQLMYAKRAWTSADQTALWNGGAGQTC